MNQTRLSPRDNDLAQQQGEADKAYADRMVAAAVESRNEAQELVASANRQTADLRRQRDIAWIGGAIIALLAVLGMYFSMKHGDGVAGDISLLAKDHKVIIEKIDGIKIPPAITSPAGALRCPAADNVVITREEYDKLKSDAAKCEKPKAPVVHKHRPAPKREVIITERRAESVQPEPSQVKTFWGWVHPDATATNKKPCFADRKITGMPTQCSSVEVFPRSGSETEKEWNARVAAKNGIAVGNKTDKGTITSTQFGRVEVK